MSTADLDPSLSPSAPTSVSAPAETVRHHNSHNALTDQTELCGAAHAQLNLDAIIVPGTRPAANLDHAVTLARAADCWLVVLCSRQLQSSDVKRLLAARRYKKAIVIDLPARYSHDLLSFPRLHAINSELPQACRYYTTDLSMKRNIGLVLARMLEWQHIFFLDDDIRDIAYPDLQRTVDMLESFSAAGFWITEFPDNSIVCHANRLTGSIQDVFVSGAALAVNCATDIGFFPDIYNEDWLFFFDDASGNRLANSYLKATQLEYDPFKNPRRAAWQEFGDVIAEGLFSLLHHGREVAEATSKYWESFLEARRVFLEAIVTRSQAMDDKLIAPSVQWALKCSLAIKPDLCERYVQAWRQDLADWKPRLRAIAAMPSIDAALMEMGLTSAMPTDSHARGLSREHHGALPPTPGAVTIPRPDTLQRMPDPEPNTETVLTGS